MKQSFAWWAFTMGASEAEQLALLRAAADIGYGGAEMVPEELWGAAQDAGLQIVTMTGHDIEEGFNDLSNHDELSARVSAAISTAAAGGVPYVIVFSGNAASEGSPAIDQETGVANCATGLAPLAAEAEAAGVTLVLELLNSKVDHPGYHCDNSAYGFDVVRRVDSPGLKVLFDLYHMQLMEGDLIRSVKANLDLIGHIHTAGAPGRRDLDDRQEVHWPGIAGVLNHIGYDGWVGHEFMPRGDATEALRQAHGIFAAAGGGA